MDEEALEKERKELERRQKELSAPKMQELKTAALAHFDEWRGKVAVRIGEAVNAEEELAEQEKTAKPEEPKTEEKKLSGDISEVGAVNSALQKVFPPVKTTL